MAVWLFHVKNLSLWIDILTVNSIDFWNPKYKSIKIDSIFVSVFWIHLWSVSQVYCSVKQFCGYIYILVCMYTCKRMKTDFSISYFSTFTANYRSVVLPKWMICVICTSFSCFDEEDSIDTSALRFVCLKEYGKNITIPFQAQRLNDSWSVIK